MVKFHDFVAAAQQGSAHLIDAEGYPLCKHPLTHWADKLVGLPVFRIVPTPEIEQITEKFRSVITLPETPTLPFPAFGVEWGNWLYVVSREDDGTTRYWPIEQAERGWMGIGAMVVEPDLRMQVVTGEGVPLDNAGGDGVMGMYRVSVLCRLLDGAARQKIEIYSLSLRRANANLPAGQRFAPTRSVVINVGKVKEIMQRAVAANKRAHASRQPHDRRSHTRRWIDRDGQEKSVTVKASRIHGGGPTNYVVR